VTGFSHLSGVLRCSTKCGDFLEEGRYRIELRLKHLFTVAIIPIAMCLFIRVTGGYETTGQFTAVVKLEPFSIMVVVFLLICIQFVSVDMTLIGNAFRTGSSIISPPACF